MDHQPWLAISRSGCTEQMHMKLTELIGRALPFFKIHIGTPAGPERIRELSRKLNIAFPPDYRQRVDRFLKRAQGLVGVRSAYNR